MIATKISKNHQWYHNLVTSTHCVNFQRSWRAVSSLSNLESTRIYNYNQYMAYSTKCSRGNVCSLVHKTNPLKFYHKLSFTTPLKMNAHAHKIQFEIKTKNFLYHVRITQFFSLEHLKYMVCVPFTWHVHTCMSTTLNIYANDLWQINAYNIIVSIRVYVLQYILYLHNKIVFWQDTHYYYYNHPF